MWKFYLLNKGEPPLVYACVDDKDRELWARICANKVSDGSDADAFIMLRFDQDINEFLKGQVQS